MSFTQNGTTPSTIPTIVKALQIIHAPSSENEIRKQASDFLECQKDADDAQQLGVAMASDTSQPPPVRHFGLSLLEHAIHYRWHELSPSECQDLNKSTQLLASHVREDDPAYIRNKVAHLWVELAKKSWALDWFDMDAALLQLWNRDLVFKELVLTILESLSEDTFARDDPTAALRGQDLNNAVVEIFTSKSDFAGGLIIGKAQIVLRSSDEGWLSRITQVARQGTQHSQSHRMALPCLRKALATMRSAFAWVTPSAIVSARCLEAICGTLSTSATQDTEVQLVAVEALHTLYHRQHFDEPDFHALVYPMYQTNNVALLRALYEWSVVDVQDIDSPRYAISKKFSETISHLSNHLEGRPPSQAHPLDLSAFFQFMLCISRHQSLLVSIPIMHSWVKILDSKQICRIDALWSIVGGLLEVASERMVRYEQLPEDTGDPAVAFALDDIESLADRHAFFLHYRHFCQRIVEILSSKRPREAITHILTHASNQLDDLEKLGSSFDPSKYTKTSLPVLRLDSLLSVVEAALRGYSVWPVRHGKRWQEHEQERTVLERDMETWASNLLFVRTFDDPAFKQRVLKCAVDFSRALDKNQSFSLKVLEHILMIHVPDRPEFSAYSDAVKELYESATSEVRRLAMRHADYFATFYEDLQTNILEISGRSDLSEKAKIELPAVLMIIMQRASNVEPIVRWHRLQSFVGPITLAWQEPDLIQSLSNFEACCSRLMLNEVGPFLYSQRANYIEDWSEAPLNDQGKVLQEEMSVRFSQLPLRKTKTALGVCTDKLEKDSEPYKIACNLWSPVIPAILRGLLPILSHAHKLHDPCSWPGLAVELQSTAARVLQDRFWQAGISKSSREEFYAGIASSRSTLEGFASFVRGKLRNIRELGYSLLYSMGKLGDHFYGYKELPGPLSEALLGTAGFLSPHHFNVLLTMTRYLVNECPTMQRQHFLTPILSTLFAQTDLKCTSEWQALDRRKVTNGDTDHLTQEMKEESILRQLTFNAVTIVTSLLDSPREDPASTERPSKEIHNGVGSGRRDGARSVSIRDFIFSSPEVLEPLLLFCSHAISYRDSRSGSIIVRTIRTIVPHFATTTFMDLQSTALIREFIASNILKAAITSLNDGYFVDLQKDLATLIATIWICYGIPIHVPGTSDKPAYDQPPLTQTPRSIILSLPGISEQRVDAVARQLALTGGAFGNSRQQRSLVLGLLEGLRGVAISQLGKVDTGKEKSAMAARYLRRENMGMDGLEQAVTRVDIEAEGLELEGVAGLFE